MQTRYSICKLHAELQHRINRHRNLLPQQDK
jgi:hypothetical protein